MGKVTTVLSQATPNFLHGPIAQVRNRVQLALKNKKVRVAGAIVALSMAYGAGQGSAPDASSPFGVHVFEDGSVYVDDSSQAQRVRGYEWMCLHGHPNYC